MLNVSLRTKCANTRFNSFFYEADVEDFELAVTRTILLQRVRKRFKRKPRKQWVRATFKELEEKGAYCANL